MSRTLFPVAILAGGLATRLRPRTDTIPKSLIDINGEPFIAHQLRLLSERDACRVVLCLGHLGEMIQQVVGDGAGFGLQVEYSFDGPRLLGTAGAIRKARKILGENFFVIYGDSYLDCNYGAVQTAFLSSGKLALMTVYENEGRWDKSNVEYSAGVIVAYDKLNATRRMRHIDYGLGVFSEAAFDLVPDEQSYDLEALYQQLLKQGELAALEVSKRFYEIGSAEGIREVRNLLSERSTGKGN